MTTTSPAKQPNAQPAANSATEPTQRLPLTPDGKFLTKPGKALTGTKLTDRPDLDWT